MKCLLPVVLREAEKSDESFVVHTWIESAGLANQSHRCPRCKTSGLTIYWDCWHDFVQDAVRSNRVLVGAFTEQPGYILGWACATKDALLYCYVRETKREQGLATLLASALGFSEPIVIGAWSEHAEAVASKHQLHYRPYSSGMVAKREQHAEAIVNSAH